MSLEFDVDMSDVESKLSAVTDSIRSSASKVVNQALDSVLGGVISGLSGGDRRREVAESFSVNRGGGDSDASGDVTSKHPMASLLDTGGNLTARNSAMLAIPVGAARSAGGSPRDYDVVPIKTKADNIVLALRGSHPLEPLFILREQVTVPGYGYISRAVKAGQKTIDTEAAAAFEAAAAKG